MPSESSGDREGMNWRAVAVAAGTFFTGLTCGWLGAPASTSNPPRPAAPGARAMSSDSTVIAPRTGADQPANVFGERLADAWSQPSRSKRERAIAAIADDLDLGQVQAALAKLDEMKITEREAIRASLLAR